MPKRWASENRDVLCVLTPSPIPVRVGPHPRKISSSLPAWFSMACHPSGRRITHGWNVIERHQNGVLVLIFDSLLGEGRSRAPCTVIACHTEQNPFGIVTPPDRVIQSGGWTTVYGVWFFRRSRLMSIRRLDRYVRTLRVGSACRPKWRKIPIALKTP